jgi:multidrug efflux system outer membrane protein
MRMAEVKPVGPEGKSPWAPAGHRVSIVGGQRTARPALAERAALALFFAVALPFVFICSCAVGPNYKRPPLDVPDNFRGATNPPATNSLADLPWTGVFKDEALQELIRVALTNNYDVRIAATRVEQARALVAEARAPFFPQLNYNGTAMRGKNVTDGNPFYNSGSTADFFLADGSASWEIDLWGRVRRLTEAARAQYFASREARRDVITSLISQIAQAYFQLLAYDEQLDIAHHTTNSFGESLTIFSERMEGGVASKLETSAAQAALASAAATMPDLERQIVLQENFINALLGRNPGPVRRNHGLLQEQFPPEVPAGLPSSLVERRPDIREAEQIVRAANAEVGVAVASFFPQISLTALFGQVSPELSAFTGGAANAWNIGANLAGPLFQGGLLAGQYHQVKAQREEARLRYQSTILNAFREVSDSLTARQKYADQRAQQAIAVEAYDVAVKTATERYVAGRASYYEVLQEQQLLFPAQNELVQVEANQWLSLVQLYRALGGGYER